MEAQDKILVARAELHDRIQARNLDRLLDAIEADDFVAGSKPAIRILEDERASLLYLSEATRMACHYFFLDAPDDELSQAYLVARNGRIASNPYAIEILRTKAGSIGRALIERMEADLAAGHQA